MDFFFANGMGDILFFSNEKTEEFADLRYRVARGFVEESSEYSLKPSREFSARGCREAGIRWGVKDACVDDVSV